MFQMTRGLCGATANMHAFPVGHTSHTYIEVVSAVDVYPERERETESELDSNVFHTWSVMGSFAAHSLSVMADILGVCQDKG